MAYRPTERTEAKRRATHARIVEAAHTLIARGGYREASVAAVAARAGVATGTVYRHFPSKAGLFAEVFRRDSQREVDAVTAAADDVAGVHGRLAAAVETFVAARWPAGARLGAARRARRPAVEAERLVFRRAFAAHFAGSCARASPPATFPPRTSTSAPRRWSAPSARRSSSPSASVARPPSEPTLP